jgi:hypothetical protein
MEKQMKLSSETLVVLKNFATINEGIQFKKGTKLATVSASKTVLAEANLKDPFPDEFCVDDLNQFLSIYNSYDKPELVFDEHNINFKSGRSGTKFRKTAKSMIVTPPEKTLTMPSADVNFTLAAEDYANIMKHASLISAPNIAIQSDGETLELVAFDASNDSAHTSSIQLGDGNGKKYKIVFKTENIKLIPGSYEVTISFKGIGHFKNTKDDIQYWIAFEAKETKIGE